MKKDTRKIFFGGIVYTVDAMRSIAEAVVTENNKIIFVGSDDKAMQFAQKDAELIDLQGKLLLPGFIDSHAHPISAPYFDSGFMIAFEDTLDDILRNFQKYVNEHPDDTCYFGRGYNEWLLDDVNSPKSLLDEICCDKPVLFMGSTLHCGWCNTKALEVAGVTKDTEDLVLGKQYFVRDSEGTPNGNLIETGPTLMIMDAIEPFNAERVLCETLKLTDSYAKDGVTAIQDGGAWGYTASEGRKLIRSLHAQKKYKQRIQTCEFIAEPRNVDGSIERIKESRAIYNDDYLRADYLKILNDGNYATRSAAMLEPYSDGTNADPLLYGKALQDLCVAAAAGKIDIGIHNIGDRTAREVLLAAKAVREAGYEDARIISYHSQCVKDEDFPMFGKYKVIGNSSPQWFLTAPYKAELIGERAFNLFKLNTIAKQGVPITFSSDYPADSYGKAPLIGIEMGITRQLYDHNDEAPLAPVSECLTIEQMIEGYTINAAYQMRMEDKIGSIEPGKYADMVVLEENIFKLPPAEIHAVPIAFAVFDGEIVYKNN